MNSHFPDFPEAREAKSFTSEDILNVVARRAYSLRGDAGEGLVGDGDDEKAWGFRGEERSPGADDSILREWAN